MATSREESDLSNDLFYLCSRKLEPEKIKSYAFYKKSAGNTSRNNFVIASEDTNVISVSCNKQLESQDFTFDGVFCNDASLQSQILHIMKNVVENVIMGLNSVLVVCRLLASPCISLYDKAPMDSINCLLENVLLELLLHVKYKDGMDSSLHVSHFEVHGGKIIDLLKDCREVKDLRMSEIPSQNYFEIHDLTEKSIFDVKDISELLLTQKFHSLTCQFNHCGSVLSVSLVKKTMNSDGFEFLKIGRFIMVDFAKCKDNFLMDARKDSENWLPKFIETREFPTSTEYKIFHVLKPAFGGNAKTSIIVTPSSVLYSPEKDLKILQFISETQKILNYPEIGVKLITRSSLKEYSEEIQELREDFTSVCKGVGKNLDSVLYRLLFNKKNIQLESLGFNHRFLLESTETGMPTSLTFDFTWINRTFDRYHKNSIVHEKEKVKTVKNYLSSKSATVDSKKQRLASSRLTADKTKCEIKTREKNNENLNLAVDAMEKTNTRYEEEVSMKADEIISMKQLKIFNNISKRKLELKLSKTCRDCEVQSRSLESLKSDVTRISCGMCAEQTSLRSTLELLIVNITSTLTDFQTLEEGLLAKLNDFNKFDVKIWRHNIENLLSEFSSFIDKSTRNFHSVKLQMSTSPLHVSQNKILKKIRNDRKEMWHDVLSSYFHKIQKFCDFSINLLSDVMCQLDEIQDHFKAELETVGSTLCSSTKAFKKFMNDISSSVKMYQHFFEEHEKALLNMADIQHKFKKDFHENIGYIKRSLLNLKEMCLGHNNSTIKKWTEISKECCIASEKHADLSEHFSIIHKEMSKFEDSLTQSKLKAIEQSPMQDETEAVEKDVHRLLDVYKEMSSSMGGAFEVLKKGNDEELLEVRKSMTVQKTEVEKHFETFSLKLKTSSKIFGEELKGIQDTFASSKKEIKESLDSLSSCISDLATSYEKYQSLSNFILEKSERTFSIIPTNKNETKDDMPDLESLIIDEGGFKTSTPKVIAKKLLKMKKLNLSHEKKKILEQIKSVVEQNISEKQIICTSDLEVNQESVVDLNQSTMSLPVLSTYSKPSTKATRGRTSQKQFRKKCA